MYYTAELILSFWWKCLSSVTFNLLALARNGQQQAFRELYERYRDPLFRFGYRLTASAETAEDLVHDCFIGLIRSPSRYAEHRASLRTYLYAAVRNLARKHFRDESPPEPPPEDIADTGSDCLSVLINEETARRVQQAIATLPVFWREVLILAGYEGLGMAEISGITGDEVNAVKVRLHRARQALKRTLITGKENYVGRKG